MLEEYRSRNLIIATDALPAVSEFARLFTAETGDQYCAGLWRGDLLDGLTWRLDSSRMAEETPLICLKEHESKSIDKYFAPL
jgi:hypothetical protein